MAAIPKEGSRVILTLREGRQIRGTVGVEVGDGKVTFRHEGALVFEAIRWAEVWSWNLLPEEEKP